MKLFDFGLVVFRSLDLVRKHDRQAINRLPFPCCHLRWMDFVLGCNLLRRPVFKVGYILARCPNLPDHFTLLCLTSR